MTGVERTESSKSCCPHAVGTRNTMVEPALVETGQMFACMATSRRRKLTIEAAFGVPAARGRLRKSDREALMPSGLTISSFAVSEPRR